MYKKMENNKMKTIRLNENCNKNITKMAKRMGSTKTDFVRIIFENISDDQVYDIFGVNWKKTSIVNNKIEGGDDKS